MTQPMLTVIDRARSSIDGEGGIADRGAESLGEVGHCRVVQSGRERDELLAAPAHQLVLIAESRAQARGHDAQDGVADEVALGVVDLLEVVDVGDDHPDRGGPADGAPQLVGRQLELTPVAEAGERVQRC